MMILVVFDTGRNRYLLDLVINNASAAEEYKNSYSHGRKFSLACKVTDCAVQSDFGSSPTLPKMTAVSIKIASRPPWKAGWLTPLPSIIDLPLINIHYWIDVGFGSWNL